MPTDVTSLHSSDSESHSVEAFTGNAEASMAAPRRRSFLRRLSQASSFATFSDYQGEVAAQGDEMVNIHSMDLNHGDFFGTHQLAHSYSRETKTSPTSVEEFPVAYQGPASDGALAEGVPRMRRKSTVVSAIQAVTTKLGFWDKDFHADRIKIILTFLSNYAYLVIGFMLCLCIYLGSYYQRTLRLHNLHYGIFIADHQVGSLPAVLGPIMANFFTNITALQATGTFHIIDYETLSALAAKYNNSLTQEVYRQVHHQKYWGAFYVHENATLNIFQALKTATAPPQLSSSLMEAVYETGRDYNTVNNYVTTAINLIIKAYNGYISQTPLLPSLMAALNATEKNNVINNAPGLLTNLPSIQMVDRLPVPSTVAQAPLGIGLVYLVIFTFFQFMFSIKIHMYVASKVKGVRYLIYRIVTTQLSYVVLSLSYVVLNRAFGMKTDVTFGKAGFLVVWAFAFLTMSSLGSLIEMLGLVVLLIKPPLIGFVFLIVAVLNVAPTIAHIDLCPRFFRYGYAMPVRNSYELMGVAYFNAYKGRVGLNIGIMVAWILATNAVLPFYMKMVAKKMAQAAEQKKIEEADEKADEKTDEKTKDVSDSGESNAESERQH